MEEKVKSNILIYIIVVISLIIILLICGGIILYKNLMNNNNNKIQNEEKNFYNYINNQQENSINQDNYDGSINKQITLNGESVNIELNYINGDIIEENEGSNLYSQKYDLIINSKKIDGIEDGSKYINTKNQINGDLYTTTKVKDKVTNNEYLVLQVYKDLIAAGPTINVYIIDYKEGKIITKLVDDKNCSTYFLIDKMQTDENGEYILNEEAQLKMKILDNEIISYEYNKDVAKLEKKIYTINNGKIESKVDKAYETSDIWGVGKSW